LNAITCVHQNHDILLVLFVFWVSSLFILGQPPKLQTFPGFVQQVAVKRICFLTARKHLYLIGKMSTHAMIVCIQCRHVPPQNLGKIKSQVFFSAGFFFTTTMLKPSGFTFSLLNLPCPRNSSSFFLNSKYSTANSPHEPMSTSSITAWHVKWLFASLAEIKVSGSVLNLRAITACILLHSCGTTTTFKNKLFFCIQLSACFVTHQVSSALTRCMARRNCNCVSMS